MLIWTRDLTRYSLIKSFKVFQWKFTSNHLVHRRGFIFVLWNFSNRSVSKSSMIYFWNSVLLKILRKKKLESWNILKCKQIYLEIFESKHNFHYSILFNLYSDKIKLNKASHLQVCSLFPGMTYLEIPGRNSLVVKRINRRNSKPLMHSFADFIYVPNVFFFKKKKLNALFE